MTLNLNPPQTPPELKPRIVVFGIGGAGCNAVNNMISAQLEGVECVVANTDAQALNQSSCDRRVQLGMSITQGLGAGSRPEIGRAAAEEGMPDIVEQLQSAHMVFLTAGMGGGTGTGASPVIARAAREHGILTVGVVTKPFHFEGAHRMRVAEEGITELQDVVDTLIVIPNQNLFRLATERTTFADAFNLADDVLYSGVRGITDLMVMPGLINLDFADIRTVMGEMGKAMMGAGEAEGDSRAVEAAEAAISNPLLDDVSMAGAKGLLINITGGSDLTLYEVDEAANRVRDEVDPGANIIFGSAFDGKMDGRLRVSVFATGIDADAASRPRPVVQRAAAPTEQPRPSAAATPPQATQPTPQPAPEPVPDVAAEAAREAAAPGAPETFAKTDATIEQKEMFTGAAKPTSPPASSPATTTQATPATPTESPDAPAPVAPAPDQASIVHAPAVPVRESKPERKQSFFGLRLKKRRDDKSEETSSGRPPQERDRRERVIQRLLNQHDDRDEPTEPRRGTAVKISRPVFSDNGRKGAPAEPKPRPESNSAPARVEPAPPRQSADAPAPSKPVVVTAAPVESKKSQSDDEDEDLLEIPAFLRRQAN